jgi:hypothetical protein
LGISLIGCPSCPFKGRREKAKWLQHSVLLDLFPRSQPAGREFEFLLDQQILKDLFRFPEDHSWALGAIERTGSSNPIADLLCPFQPEIAVS